MTLEVPRCFVKTVVMRQIVELVDCKEQLGNGGIDVGFGIDMLALGMFAPCELVVESSSSIVMRSEVVLEC